MNINESLRDWIEHKRDGFTALDDVEIVTMGETDDLAPPFLAIYETSSEPYVQNGVTLYGVSTFEIAIDLETVAVDESEGGTAPEDERQMREDLYNIVGNRDAIEWINGRNHWNVFDIRLPSPTTAANEGRRVSRFALTVIAHPI